MVATRHKCKSEQPTVVVQCAGSAFVLKNGSELYLQYEQDGETVFQLVTMTRVYPASEPTP